MAIAGRDRGFEPYRLFTKHIGNSSSAGTLASDAGSEIRVARSSYDKVYTKRVLCSIVLVVVYILYRAATPKQLWTCNGSFPDLLAATTEELTSGLENRGFTSVDLVNAYVARILEVNTTLHAVNELNPDALMIAANLDLERSNGITRGPLHGLPMLIKNNIATNDKMSTTAGSFALHGAKVSQDATVVAKLRNAGVIILGKTNLSQWSSYRSNNISNGWSALGGQTYAAYYPDQDASGSSSGSGVSSSLGLALASLGTETAGSIILPASVSNIVGIKPTVGLTSRNLVIPISQHQDTVGPLARTVKDAAYLLQAIVGPDPLDNYTSAIPLPIPDYVAACNISSLVGARFGVPRNLMYPGPESAPVLAAFENSISEIHTAGATVVDNTNVTAYAAEFRKDGSISTYALNADFFSDLPRQYLLKLAVNPNNITSVANLRNFTQNHALEAWPDCDTGVWDASLDQGFGNTDSRFWPLHQQNLDAAGLQGILGLLTNHSLDALVLPSDFAPDFPGILGTPIVTVPMGSFGADAKVIKSSRGMVQTGPNIPFGLSFIGPKWSEAKLISYAYAFEQRTKFRDKIRPYVSPNTELADIVHCQA